MIATHLKKIRPAYFAELQHSSNPDPIFVAVNWSCLNFIRNHHGICLLCDKNCEFYDLHFCKNKEVWVLYSKEHEFLIAKRLGNALLRHGANKVIIEPAHRLFQLVGENYE